MHGNLILSLFTLLFLCRTGIAQTLTDVYAFCDGCWCVPDTGETCPEEDIPETMYSNELMSSLRLMRLENPMTLSCDPYVDMSCDTVPPLENAAIGAVCAAEIMHSEEGQCPKDSSYRLHTVASKGAAEASFFLVTHEGPCGVCSTFQDLAVYIVQPDLAEAGIECAFRSIVNIDDGLKCYQEIGFSEACAAMWLYNTQNTRKACLSVCLEHSQTGAPNNLPAPGCELAECIQCDEDESGPKFQLFGGRTRRGSGLLSKIVRPCNGVAKIVHQDPCSFETPPDQRTLPAQTLSPTNDSIDSAYGNRDFFCKIITHILASAGLWLVAFAT